MKIIKFAPILFTVFLFASCSSVGLASFNTVKAKIKNGTYTGKIGSQANLASFSVKVPQASNDYEFTYMDTKENIASDFTYVSFGPAALDFSIYRVLIGKRDPLPFKVFKQTSVPAFAKNMEDTYGQPIHKIYETNTTFKGHPAFYVVYTQYLPNPSTWRTNGAMFTHGVYFIDYKKYLVILWVMGSSSSRVNAINDKNKSLIINRTWKPQVKFVNSFHLY